MSSRNSHGASASDSRVRWWCHMCNSAVDSVRSENEELYCSVCNTGFLERIENEAQPELPHLHQQEGDAGVNLNQFIQHVLGFPSTASGNDAFTPGPSTAPGSQQDHQFNNPFTGIVETILRNLAGPAAAGGGFHVVFGGDNMDHQQPMFFDMRLPSNIGDYVMNPTQFDAIITQLLNQVEGGAAPMSKAEMDALPRVKISEIEVGKDLTCPVCFDDYKLEEEVLKLPCSHIFHNECIIPWLKRHSTCPVCRKSFSAEGNNSPLNTTESQPLTSSQTSQSDNYDIELD